MQMLDLAPRFPVVETVTDAVDPVCVEEDNGLPAVSKYCITKALTKFNVVPRIQSCAGMSLFAPASLPIAAPGAPIAACEPISSAH